MSQFLLKKYIIDKKYSIAGIALLLLIWQILASWMDSALLLPSPVEVAREGSEIITALDFYTHLGYTILRGLAGFVVALALALLFGIPAGLYPKFRQLIYPLLVTLRTLPVISFILLALIWFHPQQVPVFIALLTMFPIITIGIIDGLRDIDKSYIEMGHVYRLPAIVMIRDIYLPGSLPMVFNSVSNAMAFGWRAVIIGEVLSQPLRGIGAQMQQSQIYLLVAEVIFWSIIAVVVSAFFEFIIRSIEKYAIHWK